MKIKNRKGLTFIEVILSIMLLGIISIAILPLSTYSVKYTKWNNVRLTALNLAYTQVEWAKALDYDKLGLNITGYSPKGEVDPAKYMNSSEDILIDGVKYNLITSIYWEKEASYTGEPVPQAMKKIDVSVEARDVFTGATKEFAVLGTLVSKEGEREYSEPGHITVTVNLRSANNPEKNVRIGLGRVKSYSQYANTDEKGEALFGGLSNGEYFIEPIKLRYNELVVMPNGTEIDDKGIRNWKTSKKVIVPKWNKNEVNIEYPSETFLIDYPGYIDIENKNSTIDNLNIEIKPTGESYIPIDGESPDYMTLKTAIKNIKDMKFWRLWNYDYKIQNGEEKYFLIDKKEGNLWNGKFDITNLMEPSYKKLQLSFGLESGSFTLQPSDSSKIKDITIGFTSNITDKNKIRFSINDNEISKELYTVEQLSGNNFIIKFINGKEFAGNDLFFKILNYDEILNNYGMTLAKDKSSIELILK